MHYCHITYNTDTGRIVEYTKIRGEPVETDPSAIPEGHAELVIAQDISPNPSFYSIDVETLELLDIPVKSPEVVFRANWAEIKQFRTQYISAPLSVDVGVLDADTASMQSLAEAEENFLVLSNSKGELDWKMADNTFVCLKLPQFKKMAQQAKQLRAIRTSALHKKAEELAAMDPAPLLEFIADINNWIEP